MVGLTDTFISTTVNYYTMREANGFRKAGKNNTIASMFETTYAREIQSMIEGLND